ncbi:hypothetical protein A2425_00070 [candidate division WWE3 bacterium RIFOXYC1_FULL_42_17]|uniref:Uncharacterized protein n=1 Tax=candidate division WWE3 bacterium RIFOXYB1_FULL_42_27 TaxID=1802638 RepID=A0A1F4W405_UNCKA|nr:MAG: hypothetical protein A2399_02330 [candidate division WWE3 bacterium RIFOXYB1_FULL_42_27]OGC72180.1 MAG: hypothetical protein A2578_00670 [candidate division WWE3 bacterium RIFOXYD1_FULL_42_24]OGC75475.1 MAG: hypothetical protein A2425_00070 [candidate division WWE3 bacterium RIFOXYC1_FULL_42_17]
MKVIRKQNKVPKIATPSINFFLPRKAATKITIYPISPYRDVGIPKVLDTSPLITASQFIVSLIVHKLYTGWVIKLTYKYKASPIPIAASIFAVNKYFDVVIINGRGFSPPQM